MAYDPTPHLAPERTAIIIFECQERVIGPGGPYKGLIQDVVEKKMVARIANVLAAARPKGVLVVYCNVGFRPDGLGAPLTPRFEAALKGPPGPGVSSPVVKGIEPQPADLVVDRISGMSAFTGTPIQVALRQRGISTVVPMGVSLNIGISTSTAEAVNNGFRVVVPGDCCAGDPPAYGRDVLKYTIQNLAYVTTGEFLVKTWGGTWREPA